MMKGRMLVVWMALLAGLALLSMCGSSRVGYGGGYAGGYAGVLGPAYQAGGAPAGWDTLVYVFSAAATVGDTFPYPASATAADQARIHNLNDIVRGRAEASWRDDNGDAATVVRLGTGYAVPTFAWCTIDEADTNGFYGSQFWYMRSDTRQNVSLSRKGTTDLSVAVHRQTIGSADANRQVNLFYIPFEGVIPDGATIVSASVNFAAIGNMYFDYGDSMVCVLMDKPQDDEWMKAKGGTGMTNSPNYAHASWLRQTDDNGDAWSGDEANAWSPSLASRKYYWGMGDWSDWSSTDIAPGGFAAAGSNISVSIYNCVQAPVAGLAANNGIMMLWNLGNTSSAQMLLYGWDNYSTATGRNPYVVVKCITKRYQKPFGTSDLAFVFTTDDYIEGANSAFTDTFNAHGGVYTMFGARKHVDGTAQQSGMDSLLTWLGQGFEIGPHSRQHHNPAGLTYWEQSRPGKVWDATARGQVWFDAEPTWLYALADSAIGDSLKAHLQFGKSMALPNNTISQGVQRVLADIGYLSVRGMAVGVQDRTKWPWTASWAPAYADTGMSVAWQAQRRPRNMMLLPYAMTTPYFVKAPGSASTDLDSVRHNMRRALYQFRGQGRGEFVMLTHDVKSTNPLNAGFNYDDGINPDELGAILDVVDEVGARYMTASDLGRWRRATGTAIDTPTGFFNASVDDDSARYYARDRVWYKPDGIDNRWIRGLRQPGIAATFDNVAPSSPTNLIAYGNNGSCVLSWTWGGGEPANNYRVYRYYDGSPDTTLVGTTGNTYFVDSTVTNGSPHNYFVTSMDAAGNESADSVHDAATPGTIAAIQRPAYFTFWYEDPDDGAPLSQDDVNKLADYDVVVGSPHVLEGDEGGEVAFDGLLGRIRDVNPDAIYLSYWTAFCLYDYWNDSPAESAHKRVWDYVASFADSTGFGLDESGDPVRGDDYQGQMYVNVMRPAMADTIAKIVVDSFEGSGTDGEWAGFFLDDSDTTLSEWMCNGNDCGDLIDFDQDGTTYSEGALGDAQEKAAFKEWHLRLLRAFRREFAERGMHNRLLAANTTWGRKSVPSPKDLQYMALLDGVLNEGWNRYWPGPNVPTDTSTWDIAIGWRSQLVHAQTSPPLVLWNAHADSSMQYMNEVAAYAHGGLVNVNSPSDLLGATGVHPIGRKIAALAPGLSASVAYGDVVAGDSADTLKISTGDVRAKMILSRNAGDIDNAFAVWPYVIYDGPDTLSQSVFWESEGDIGAPINPLYHTTVGDREIAVRLYPNPVGEPATRLSRDFSHFRIVRESKPASVVIRDTFMVDPDTLQIMYEEPDSYLWTSYGLTNGVQYKHKVTAFDVLGNASDEVYLSDQDRMPIDDDAPPAVTDLYSQGGDGYVDLDWSYSSFPADFENFRIWRRISGSGSAFALADSVTISAHQDSTAVGGTEYDYYVVAVDDDENASAASSTVVGSWYGDIDETYLPPGGVAALGDHLTVGKTTVYVYAPGDTTGLTGYRVFRGTAQDTAQCYKIWGGGAVQSGVITPGQFGDGYYEDPVANTDPDSTFYYTAKARYSGGHWSEKYAVPAGALSDGNYPTQIPVISVWPAAQFSAITVAVASIAGSDSTRIFRGTTAGTQTHIATVPVATNPYFDTSAVEGTDYYYKVRQTDGASVSAFSAVAGPARWNSTPSGDPAISGVSGTLVHGASVTISGANFGAVAEPAFNIYDDLESGSQSALWESDASNPPFSDVPIVAATAELRRHAGSTKHGEQQFTGDRSIMDSYGTFRDGTASRTFFGGYWFRLADNWEWGAPGASSGSIGGSLANVKFIRLSTGGSVDDWTIAVHPYSGSGIWATAVSATCNGSVTSEAGYCCGEWSTWNDSSWHHVQFEWVDSSAAGVADAHFKVWVDGQVLDEASGFVGMACAAGGYKRIFGLGFYDSWADSSSDPDKSVPYAFYIDDIYYGTKLSRVEIGDASTYGACTHREVQLPSAWSAGSITITANAGSFTDGPAYLFVIDSDGTASAGYPVTIE